MQSKLSAVKSYKKIKASEDKKSSKSYVNPVNFAIFWFCSQLELASLKIVRDCLPDVYIAENTEWIVEEFSFVWPTI